MNHSKFSIAIHGGAGTISPDKLTDELEKSYKQGLEQALNAGKKILKEGGSSTDAVCAAVVELENNPLYNAGKGSVFNHLGKHEMDASIMEGKNLNAGAVTGIKSIKNPILLANKVMIKSPHVMLMGEGAEQFALSENLEFEDENYFYTDFRFEQWNEIKNTENYQLDHTQKSNNKMGTVGAVAMDSHGNLAAATSTGGMTNKKWGRVGDTPIIGAGTYANNNTCAISCTGHGELFIRSVVAYDISCLMEYAGMSLKEACNKVVLDKLVKINGEGGLVALDKHGNIEMPFNSEGMYRACTNHFEEQIIAIYK
jgi:beta-aspartyl-peptidase (threonine type)